MSAMERLVRESMASGFACISERVAQGKVDLSAPLSEASGDFPAEFIEIRSHLVGEVRAEMSDEWAEEAREVGERLLEVEADRDRLQEGIDTMLGGLLLERNTRPESLQTMEWADILIGRVVDGLKTLHDDRWIQPVLPGWCTRSMLDGDQ